MFVGAVPKIDKLLTDAPLMAMICDRIEVDSMSTLADYLLQWILCLFICITYDSKDTEAQCLDKYQDNYVDFLIQFCNPGEVTTAE